MRFTHAIVRTPCPRLAEGLSSAGLGAPNHDLALAQHAAYVAALERCGLAVTVLPPLDGFPDSTFVEDVAICTPRCAVITRPGAPSRRGEADHIGEALAAHFDAVKRIAAPGTLDGGDVMQVGGHFFVGLTARTNAEGARQLITILESHDLTGSTIAVEGMLHLKSGVTCLENGRLLAVRALADRPEFRDFTVLAVDDDENYAANSVWLNGSVLVPAGHPRTAALIEGAGLSVIALDTSEFRKLDGGLSCLSLRLPAS